MIAHNAGYDYSFLVRDLFGISEINNCNQFISSTGFYKHINSKRTIKVQIKDSYKLISSSLKKFPEMFDLGKIEKEVRDEVIELTSSFPIYKNLK